MCVYYTKRNKAYRHRNNRRNKMLTFYWLLLYIVDDILVYSCTLEEHLDCIQKINACLYLANLKA